MADVDIDPFGEHDRTGSRTDETDENIFLTPVGGSTWEPEREQKCHSEVQVVQVYFTKNTYLEKYTN